jgi:hypothetical protein
MNNVIERESLSEVITAVCNGLKRLDLGIDRTLHPTPQSNSKEGKEL